jgi:spore coat protein U-like protein
MGMKTLILAVVVSAAALVAPAAQAQTFTSGQFNVAITLNSACALSAITDVSFTYTSNQVPAANAAGGNFNVTCTNNLPYTFYLQSGTAVPVEPFSTTSINVTDALLNLTYQLQLSAAGGNGNGNAQGYNITGTMAGSQPGNCGGATCTNALSGNRTHTLIVDF